MFFMFFLAYHKTLVNSVLLLAVVCEENSVFQKSLEKLKFNEKLFKVQFSVARKKKKTEKQQCRIRQIPFFENALKKSY